MTDIAENMPEMETELRCTCNDPYRTDVCPVHCPIAHAPAENRPTVLTDDDLVLKIDMGIKWKGIPFTCPNCSKPAILHFMDFCGACGERVIKDSDSVRRFVDNQQEMFNQEAKRYAG